jgi:hypothetical protein
LIREGGLAALQQEAQEEVWRRAPAKPAATEPRGEVTEEFIDFADLTQPEVIRTRVELDAWIASLRSRLEELLKASKVIRLGGGKRNV